jgi:signal peptidase I
LDLSLLATLDGTQKLLYGVLVLSLIGTLISRKLKLDKKNPIRDYSESFLWAVAAALLIRALLVDNFSIPSESMLDTLRVGDRLFVGKTVYGWHAPLTRGRILPFRRPERGEIVIFVPPTHTLQPYVKRCVGVPGDVLEVRAKRVFINGVETDYPAAHGLYSVFPRLRQPEIWAPGNPRYRAVGFTAEPAPGVAWNRDWYGPVTLAAGSYWMMGDNRDNSLDSRYFGPVPEENLKGTPLLRYWPLGRFGVPR